MNDLIKKTDDIFLNIDISNEQNNEITDRMLDLIKVVALECLKFEGYKGKYELSMLLVDNETIHGINKEHRDVDKPTDVLSFPQWDDVPLLSNEIPTHIGDIVISVEKAIEQADEYGHNLTREIAFLSAHSMFHLLGYDHIEEDERAVMRSKEEAVLTGLNIIR